METHPARTLELKGAEAGTGAMLATFDWPVYPRFEAHYPAIDGSAQTIRPLLAPTRPD
jgi:hypothetical protein